jgi:hypothetical protein
MVNRAVQRTRWPSLLIGFTCLVAVTLLALRFSEERAREQQYWRGRTSCSDSRGVHGRIERSGPLFRDEEDARAWLRGKSERN